MIRHGILTTLAAVGLLFAPEMAHGSKAPSGIDDDYRTQAPKDAAVYFISPKDGDVISGPVIVRFGLKGMGVAPAGTEKAKTGHHHLLINAGLPDLSYPIPADDNHVHFGGGQTETSLDLKPGTYTLQLLLGDQNHIPHKPVVKSNVITITVR